MKSLDKKLTNIKSLDNKRSNFIIADAKDADMAGGIRGPGFIRKSNGELTNKPDNFSSYVNKMDEMTKSKLIDVMLMSMSSAEILIKNKLFFFCLFVVIIYHSFISVFLVLNLCNRIKT